MKGETAAIILNLTKIVCPICNKERYITKTMLRHHIKHKHDELEGQIFLKRKLKEI